MKIIYFFLLLSAMSFTCVSAPIDQNAVLQTKRMLPLCTRDTSLYKELSKLGEQPFGTGIEKSKLAVEQRGVSLGFTHNSISGMWSILTTDKSQKTCFVAMGKLWQTANEESQPKVFKGGMKQVGFSAPFAKIKKELLKEGKVLSGFGEEDLDLSGSNIIKKTAYLFIDNTSGLFTAVTSILYKNGSGLPYEFSSIDAVGTHWVWNSSELNKSYVTW